MSIVDGFDEFRSPLRRESGLVIVLPGIEGYSHLNRRIARGLAQAGVPYAIEIFDWTLGRLKQLWSLRSRKLHAERALQLASVIAEYQAEHPGRPVHLVGHSGGAAMIALTLEALEQGRTIQSGIMLVPALSPGYDLRVALSRTEHGLWNFCSYGDAFFLGVGTLLCGTLDGRHCISAGNVGFKQKLDVEGSQSPAPPVRNVPYRWDMWKLGHTGGHLSITREPFIAAEVAPLLMPGGPAVAP